MSQFPRISSNCEATQIQLLSVAPEESVWTAALGGLEAAQAPALALEETALRTSCPSHPPPATA